MGQFDKHEIIETKSMPINITLRDMRISVFRTPSMVDEFYEEEICCADGSKVVTFVDPLFALFNQQRLESELGFDTFKKWIDQLSTMQKDPLSEIRKEISDEDLFAYIKSRHIQKPSELLAWQKHLEKNMEDLKKSVSLAKEKAEQEKLAAEKAVLEQQNSVHVQQSAAADGAALNL